MKKKTRVLVISYTAALVRRWPSGLIACRTDAGRRRTAMDANYRHAYGEVLNAVQELDAALQKSLYATTPAMACTVCTDIYSHAQTAQMALGVLPVQSHALARIARNIALAGDYARTLSRSAAEGRAFAAEELAQLRALSETTTQLSVGLVALGASLADGAVTTAARVRSTQSLANLDAETELPIRSKQSLRRWQIHLRICRCRSLTARIVSARRRSTPWRRVVMTSRRGRHRLRLRCFWTWTHRACARTGRSEGAVPCWNFDIDDGDDASYISLTVKGGEVLRYYSSCNGGEPVLSPEQAAETAADFLRARGYTNMRLLETEDAGRSVICTFCYVQDGVLCTADRLRVRIRLDSDAVCGFSSAEYLDTHRARTLPEDVIGAEAGRAAVPGSLQVLDMRTALLRLYGARERLCYEYLCETDDGQRCIIAVNARTGQQERIRLLDALDSVQPQF